MIATGTERTAQDMIAKRQIAGIAKYGTTLRDGTFSRQEILQHAAEEAADLLVYLLRAIEEIDKESHADAN